jgi:RimJ/RimL family protein N-acetyltransferase
MRFPQDVPTISDDHPTSPVTLRPHRAEDAHGSLEQCLDPLSRQWTTVPLTYTLDDARRFVTQAMPGGWSTETEWGFAVEALDDTGVRRYAGTVSLRDEGEARAEIAYGSHPWVRGRGVMERALRLLLRWGFEERGLQTVIWWANKGNWASRKLAWRLGFAVEGAPRQWLPQRGELLDAWVGTLLATDGRQPTTPWHVPPQVAGDRVALRRLRESDDERVVEGCTDPVTRQWLGQLPHPYRVADAEWFRQHTEERHATGQAVTWAMADPAGDALVGLVNLFDIRPGTDAELGYWVHPAARGRGVASEACRLALRHAFVDERDGGLGLVRVRARAAEENTGSRRVLDRSGLTCQGRERRAIRIGGGVLADAALYDIVAEEHHATAETMSERRSAH